MKRQISLIFILILSMFFSGCFKRWDSSTEPVSFILELEWEQELPWLFEVTMKKGSEEYLLILKDKKEESLELSSGTWSFQALARAEDGTILAFGKEVKMRLSQKRSLLKLSLPEKPVQAPLPEISHLTAEWSVEGMHLFWQSDQENAGLEIFRRKAGELLWRKLALVGPGIESFLDSDAANLTLEYALRTLTENEDLKGPLNFVDQVAYAFLQVQWRFEHDFSYLPQARMQKVELTRPFKEPREEFKDLIARFHNLTDFAKRTALLEKTGLIIKRELPALLAVLVEPARDSTLSLAEWSLYFQDEFYLEPNWILQAEGTPALFREFETPWNYFLLRLPKAWEISQGSKDVRIAVLDSGLDATAFPRANILPGYNFIGNNENTNDDNGHGTQVAGIITQVMPQVSLQPVKVLNHEGSGNDFTVAEGILYAAGLHSEHHNFSPAHVMNLSLGGLRTESSLMGAAILEVVAGTDVIMIAAAGNDNQPSPLYPAAYPEVIAVGAVAPGQGLPLRTDYSNYGPGLDFAAPGGSNEYPLQSTDLGGREAYVKGTSFAAPHATGVVGLMLSEGILPREIKPILEATAMDLGPLGWDEEYGYGLINANWALRRDLSFKLFVYSAETGQVMREIEIPVGASEYPSLAVPAGELFVKAWLDLGEPNVRDGGDYFFRSEPFFLETGAQIELETVLKEIRQ